jgi:phosphoribosylanthranilate isomerase
MSLKTKVKVGRVTNLSEARYCAGMGVDLLGFPVGDDGLKAEQYRQMIEWVAGPELVLEAHHSQTRDLKDITDNYPGHYIEVGRNQLHWLTDKAVNFIVAIEPKDWVNVYGNLMGLENIKYIELINASARDASTVRAIGVHFSVLIELKAADDLSEALKLNAAGISLTGSDEEKPGLKNYGYVADILESLESEV